MVRTLGRHRLAAVLTAAAVVRLVIFLAFPSIFDFVRTGVIHGSDAYDRYAQNLIQTGVYGQTPGAPDALIPPLYSYVLAGLYSTLGRSAASVAALHIALDCLSIAFVYAIARRLFEDGDAVALISALCFAFYPYLIFQNLTVIDTPLFMALLYAFLWSMSRLRDQRVQGWHAGLLSAFGGLCLGAGMLVRPILPPLAIMIAVWFLLRLTLYQTVARLLPVAVISALALVPWIARNDQVFGAFVPMTTTSGANFWQGNSRYTVPYFRAGYDVQWTAPDPEELPDGLDEREADARRFALALQFLRDNPDKIPELLWVKFLVHWSIDIAPRLNPVEGQAPRLDYQGDVILEAGEDDTLALGGLPPGDPVGAYSMPLFDQIGRAAHRVYWGGLFLLGLAGIVLSRRQWRDVSLLWFVQISMTLVYVAFHPSTRYRVPTDPAFFMFSAYALVWLWRWLQARRAGSPSGGRTLAGGAAPG